MFAAESTDGYGLFVPVLVALIAAVPGIIAGFYSFRSARDSRHKADSETATEFGTEMAKTAFLTLQGQVNSLLAEQNRWAKDREEWGNDRELWEFDRDVWKADKGRLLIRINELTVQLGITNRYLNQVLDILLHHGLQQPPRPEGIEP